MGPSVCVCVMRWEEQDGYRLYEVGSRKIGRGTSTGEEREKSVNIEGEGRTGEKNNTKIV